VLFGGISRVFACVALIDKSDLNRFAGFLSFAKTSITVTFKSLENET
jgi:hypothetical protein